MPKKKVEINPECGTRLKILLTRNGMTQRECAEKLDVDPKHLWAIANGKKRLTPENAQKIADMFPPVRAEWLLCKDDYETEAEKDVAKEKAWEEKSRAVELYDKAFRCFVESLECLQGYGLNLESMDFFSGECVAVTNNAGACVGVIPKEAYRSFQAEVEHYASYLIRQLIKTELQPLQEDRGEGVGRWLTFKNAATKTAN